MVPSSAARPAGDTVAAANSRVWLATSGGASAKKACTLGARRDTFPMSSDPMRSRGASFTVRPSASRLARQAAASGRLVRISS